MQEVEGGARTPKEWSIEQGSKLREWVMESSSGRGKRTFRPKSGMIRMKVRGTAAH